MIIMFSQIIDIILSSSIEKGTLMLIQQYLRVLSLTLHELDVNYNQWLLALPFHFSILFYATIIAKYPGHDNLTGL